MKKEKKGGGGGEEEENVHLNKNGNNLKNFAPDQILCQLNSIW